jgi:predicted tellurium resistance membrane protein TerC
VVLTSNLFAIAGLRSLYGILSRAATDLVYLEKAVAIVLGFIGSKMIAETAFGVEVPTNLALLTVATVLGGGIGLSVLEKNRQQQQDQPDDDETTTTLEMMKQQQETLTTTETKVNGKR